MSNFKIGSTVWAVRGAGYYEVDGEFVPEGPFEDDGAFVVLTSGADEDGDYSARVFGSDVPVIVNKIFLRVGKTNTDSVDHPSHYGGGDNVYEAIKVIEAWDLGFCLGNTVKYISRAGKKDAAKELEDLRKARWYIERHIERLESKDN